MRHPKRNDPPLVVYTNAVLSAPAALQRFEPVTRRRQKIGKLHRVIEHLQFARCHTFDVDEAPDPLAVEKGLRLGTPEGPDHLERV
jgi:hypothetical protein